MRTLVHISSNCSIPRHNGFYRAAQRGLFFALLLLVLVLFVTTTVIPGFCPLPRRRAENWGQSEQSSSDGWEDPQIGLTADKQEPGPGSCYCSTSQAASAVWGAPFEFLCLISHVYSEADNAAFVCPVYSKCNEMRCSKMTNDFQCLVWALSWRRLQKGLSSLLLGRVAWRGSQAVSSTETAQCTFLLEAFSC